MEPTEAFERSAAPPTPGREAATSGTAPGFERCQVRSETDAPCGRPAATEILGVLFCERCSLEQEAYFAVGELTQTPRGDRAGLGRPGRAERALRSGGPAALRRRIRGVATAGGRVSLLSVVLASLLAAAACGGTERAPGEAAAEPKVERSAADGGRAGGQEATTSGAGEAGGAVARAGDAEARAGGPATGGNSREGQGAAEDDAADGAAGDGTPGKVMLRVRGDRGTEFSGVCSVGDQERNLEGRAPERYAFGPGGSKLECEIRNDGGGDLEVALAGEGVRSVQQTNSRGATVRFALSEGGFSSSTLSSSTS